MSGFLDVPRISELRDLGVEVEPSELDGVLSLRAWAGDGSSVTLTWDEMAASATILWVDGDQERYRAERETASKISVREEAGWIQFHVWFSSEGLGGKLVVWVGEKVSVSDSLLQT